MMTPAGSHMSTVTATSVHSAATTGTDMSTVTATSVRPAATTGTHSATVAAAGPCMATTATAAVRVRGVVASA